MNENDPFDRQRVYSGAPWEQGAGYCRAVKAGSVVHVSGTAPVDERGGVYAPGDAYAQARRCFEIAAAALAKLNCPLAAVVRTRLYVTDIGRWQEYGRAHREFFGNHPPATTMVEVKALIAPAMLVEVEVEAQL